MRRLRRPGHGASASGRLAAQRGHALACRRHQEAEALTAYREPDRLSLVLRLGLARSLNGQARHEEALAQAEQAEEVRRGLPQEQSRPEAGAVELAVGTALLGLRRGNEACLSAAAAHDVCLASFGPGHRRTVEARTLLDLIDGA
ncbi:hypothetical protein AB0E78_22905 [Streptomyces sp. NPDC032198]|uniref:hypothetical protein n=1 Tax=Streptomyces sp. NPDC032198 TaxID=3155127 RepID=UPI003406EF49